MSVFSRRGLEGHGDGFRARLHRLPSWAKWGALVLAAIALVSMTWLGLQGFKVKSNLEKARTSAQQAKDALLSGKPDEAMRAAENTEFFATEASSAANSFPWGAVGAIPWVGSPLKTTQQIADVVSGLARDVLLPAAKMGTTVSPDKLIEGTRIDLQLLRSERSNLEKLSAAADMLNDRAQDIARPSYLSPISSARSQLQDQTSKLSGLLSDAAIAAQLAPSMLGGDGPRTYLMGFQTPAEARGTGGLIGGFGILRFDNGTPTIDTLSNNIGLRDATARIDLGPEFDKVYGWTNPLTDFRNSNLSPHFPYAAQIWRAMWQDVSGQSVDGVIAIDPVVLSYVLGAIGPVTLADGEVITAENVVELTMSTAYFRFPQDPIRHDANARKQYLQDIAGAVVKKLAGPLPSPRKLLDALGRAASEGRIEVWSASPADQAILEKTSLAHAVPNDDAPYAQVVVNNLGGGKMDYYLRRDIEYSADGCDGDMRNSTVTVRLTNTAKLDQALPGYVGSTENLAAGLNLNVPNGTMVSSIRIIATKGARLLSVTSNGERTTAITQQENGHPSFEVQVAIPPEQSGELTFRLSEPTAPGEARVPVQPLVDNVTPKVAVPACS